MRGQTSLLVKGIYLVLILVTISVVLNRIVTSNLASSEQERSFRQRSAANSLLETLAGSSNCLAYEETGKVEGKDLELSPHRVLDKRKLDDFSSKFSDIQPDCARDFTSGYRVDVETFPVNISSEVSVPEDEPITESFQLGILFPTDPPCTTHDVCSQACSYLGIETYYPRNTYLGLGNCPYNKYGCMSRECCIGQCDRETGKCLCINTTFVTLYGDVCSFGYFCANDCKCHFMPAGPKETIALTIPAMFWSFGDLEFSEKDSLRETVSISTSVVVFIDDTTSIPGKMTITMADGELERLRGFVDRSCLTGVDFQDSLMFHYPASFDSATSSFCLEIDGKKVCQKISCKKSIDFTESLTPGSYTLYSKNEDNTLMVMV